ncbi:lysylphosphatidylglycerol synthase transmembrane domain-containing protein [Actinospica sp.]|uniref:lysylphosphatidylglycerol synthase transmembrane domain-containing protein n=1 Tax=Actinospica sp. TaxID=1872142 RepID=UPI002D16ACAE|nr:lysylphosphatidylglycerol synthase transmembrane domain-containing protein [Actinospica sp.]HWG28066.1 lysylphosphatidylglycerol synthase transmembrane domain-containing protein [Actinospica sp.]
MATSVLDEPDVAGRIRRGPDLIRVLFESLMIMATIALGGIGAHTSSGLESDVHNGVEFAPAFILGAITVLTNAATVAIPVGLAIERLVRGDGKHVANAVIAAAVGCGITSVLNVWITSSYAPGWLLSELTRHLGSGTTPPLHIYLVTVIAFLTALGFNDRPSLRTFTWVCVAVYFTATLISGDSALVGLIVTFLLGRGIGFGWRYARGVANERPGIQIVLAELGRAGLAPVSCHRKGEHKATRRYEVRCADDRRLEVAVLDRDRQAVGLIYRIYRHIRLRGPAQQRNPFSLRRTVEHEALLSYALADAGISTPKLLAVREPSADSALLAYEHVPARSLDRLADEEFTDELIEGVWNIVRELGRHQIAHRRLALDSILADEHGQIWLTELRNGEIAADELQHLLDIAATMAALALKAGPERTVRIGADIIGEDRIGAALPFLQPVLLTRGTRLAARKSKHLLRRLREQILEIHPQAPTTEPVKLERLKPRTILTVSAGCFAVYVLMLEIASAGNASGHSPWQLMAAASPWWLLIAAATAALTYVAAAMQLAGFIPENLPKAQNLMVQLASSFVALFTPAAVGGVALNVRFLQRRGIPTGPALSAVGAGQAVAFIIHIALIATFGFFASGGATHDEASTTMIAILLAIAVLAMTTLTVAPLRRLAKRRLVPFFEGSLPRLLDVAQNPRKLALALGGTLSISLLNALCLWSCIHALGGHAIPSYPTVALMYLTVQAVSSASPTPAGMGAVELGLGGALALAGVAKPTAVVAVLVYRLLTTYLPAVPGYAALGRLRHRRAV